MSFFGLGLMGKSLAAFQDAENVTSDNIANVNTPGASRQVTHLVQAPPIVGSPFYATNSGQVGTMGDGVLVQSIQRIHDDSYDSLFRSASSSSNFYQIQQQVLQGTQASFGEPTAGISAAFSDYQAALHALAANPTGTAERSGVLTSASALVQRISSTGLAIQTQQSQVQQQATTVVSQANGYIDQIAALNAQIRAAKAVGDNPNTYLDQRDHLVDQLSQLLGTQTALQANGSALVTVGGRALVNDTVAYHLAPPVVGTYPTGDPQAGVPRLVIGFANDPNPKNPAAVVLGSGQLQSYVDLYNNKLQTYANQINDFANGLAWETAKITNGSYDLNGIGGGALFQPIVAQQAISATNIKVGVTDPTQLAAGSASTAAGTLVRPLNAANNSVSGAGPLTQVTLNNPAPVAGLKGYLQIQVDGFTDYYYYDTTGQSTGPDHNGVGTTTVYNDSSTLNNFVTNFNAQHFGVDAAFDATSQKIVFTRDPANVDLAHRAQQGTSPATPAFEIGDSLITNGGLSGIAAGPPAALAPGVNGTSLLQVLGAGAINGVQQNSTNAWGTDNAGGVNALLGIYAQSLGVPGLQTTGAVATTAGTVTLTQPSAGAFARINVGDTLTLDAVRGPAPPPIAPQEDVVVSAVDRNAGTITYTAKFNHAAGFSITSAQNQTLGQAYASLVSKVGLDTSTAINGTTQQGNLVSNIDKVRQGVDGISIDEETQNLVKYQNAYQAAAQTINVLDKLLQTAIGLIH